MAKDVTDEAKRVKQKVDSTVRVVDFRKVYTSPFRNPVVGTENVSFGVDSNECFALLGVNGAGKSTTFKSMTNAVEPTEGEIRINGQNVNSEFETVRKVLGYCPQHHALFSSITVLEHLIFYSELKRVPNK